MDNDELIDRLNTLQAQNIALMHLVAAVINKAGLDVRNEYAARCAIFRIVTEPNEDEDAIEIQRETFARVGRTVLGDCNAATTE
ncbi:MAG TPA: hypothetical protein DCK83_00595 [Gallionellaceae bacterium]|nr:hypothetical protein [Gallionellaceae bacterium]